ncbi:hypothetical protein [Nonomuraea sp. NPDC050643]|uniref:hypothetical protein n=1 Tax=Nonomuraea sp. NPDC050643 TaxID=3155660 RepID=UPI00341088CA
MPLQDRHERPGSPRVLTLDFPGPRSRHRVRHLDIEAVGADVVHLLDTSRPRDLTASGYARALLDGEHLAGPDVAAIVTYCAAAPIAREVSLLLRRAGSTGPRLYAINPEQSSMGLAVDTLQSFLSACDHPRPVTPPLTRAAVDGAAEALFRGYLAGGEATPEMMRMARELATAQADWVSYLAAAGDPGAPPVTAAEVHITSRDHACPPSCVAGHLVAGGSEAELFADRGLGARIGAAT